MLAQDMIGRTALVTTDGWFIARDGQSYQAVWGTLHGVHSDSDTLGIKTNARSTNWYLQIGDMLIAGCQIHYLQMCDSYLPVPFNVELRHELSLALAPAPSRIWNADQSIGSADTRSPQAGVAGGAQHLSDNQAAVVAACGARAVEATAEPAG